MSVQDSITNEIADLIEAEKNIELVIGPNLPENKFCIVTGGGNVQDTFLDKSMLSILPITINGKHSDQEYLYKMLNRILEYLIFLITLLRFLRAISCEIVGIKFTISAEPTVKGKNIKGITIPLTIPYILKDC